MLKVPVRVAVLFFGVALPTAAPDVQPRFELLSHLLGDGLSSVLNRQLREELGLTYAVSTYTIHAPSGGMLCGVLVTPVQRRATTYRALRKQLQRTADEIDQPTFERAKRRALGAMRDVALRVAPVAEALVQAFVERRVLDLEGTQTALESMTLDDARTLAKQILQQPEFVVVAPY